MADRFGKNQKPLFVVNGPVKAKGYRSKFTPFAITRFLDGEKLKKMGKQSLEVGTLEASGHSATLVAEIRRGTVVGLSLKGCVGCGSSRKSKLDKKTLRAIDEKMGTVRGGTFKLPGVAMIAGNEGGGDGGDIFIPIWPFPPIIIILEPSTFCAGIRVGSTFCVWCPDTGGFCL